MKKAISILLTLVLLLGIVSGCGKEPTDSTQAEASAQTETSASAESSTASAESTLSEVRVTLPCSTGTRALAEGEAVIATQLYLLSRAYCEKLAAFDTDSFDAQEYTRLVAETWEALRQADAFCTSLEGHAEALIQIEEQGTARQEKASYELLAAPAGKAPFSLFATVAYAAGDKSPAVQYAEEITQAFDNAKNGQKLKTLAQLYGTDVKHAKAMLEQAQATLEGSAYEDQAAVENECYKLAVETKAAASNLGFGLAVITTGGAAAVGGVTAAGIVEAGGLVCSGLQAIIDTGTAASIHLTNGEGNEDTVFFEKADEALAPIATAFSIGGGIQNIIDYKNPDKAAEKVVNAAQALLVGVGLGRDYVQDGKVLGVSANIIDGYREIILHSADCSDSEAAKKVLTETGVSPEALENPEAASAGSQQTEGMGAAADAYIAAFEGLVDPEDPADVDAFLEAVDAAFTEYASSEGVTLEAAAEPELAVEPETSPEADAAAEADAPAADPEEAEEPEAVEAQDPEAAPSAQEGGEPAGESPAAAGSGGLSAYEVAGSYYFAGLDGSENMTIEATDDTHLTVTDVNFGESISGTYDESTGLFTAVLSDRFSWYVTISFTSTEDGIRADYENSQGGIVSSASSAIKDGGSGSGLPISALPGTYPFQGSGDVWTQIVTVVDDTHLMLTDAEDPEAVIIGYYDEGTGIFSYSETGYMGETAVTSSVTVTFAETADGIKADMVLSMTTEAGSQEAVASAMKQ